MFLSDLNPGFDRCLSVNLLQFPALEILEGLMISLLLRNSILLVPQTPLSEPMGKELVRKNCSGCIYSGQ